mmetsp:Transcript_18506/g.57482  ORF Transcript_18506/g.57482 Transcript_18506/m.57482 type:complete len:307 (-) Transcript_18506:167-1087(-)
MPTPVAIEKVRPMVSAVAIAGTHSETSSQLSPASAFIIEAATKSSAGVVAKGATEAASGEKNSAARKSTPVVTAARPVHAPTATPAPDSAKLVTVDVPITAPPTVATASASIALRICGGCSSPALPCIERVTPTSVPAVSMKSMKSRLSTAPSMPGASAARQSAAKSVGARLGGMAKTPLNGCSPMAMAITEQVATAISTEPATRRLSSATASASPQSAITAGGAASAPAPMMVAGSAATTPAFLRPTSPSRRPMPAAVPLRRPSGIACSSFSRSGVRLSARKATPETATAPSAVCHASPCESTSV